LGYPVRKQVSPVRRNISSGEIWGINMTPFWEKQGVYKFPWDRSGARTQKVPRNLRVDTTAGITNTQEVVGSIQGF